MRLVMEQNSHFSMSKLALLDEEVAILPSEMQSAWMRVEGKVKGSPRSSVWWWRLPLAAAAAVAALVLVTPLGRVWAQSLWTRFVLTQTVSIKIDLQQTAPSL